MKKIQTISFILIFIFSPKIYSATININKFGILMIEGEITRGDFDNTIKLIKKYGKFPNLVGINSPGGSVIESMKIGGLVRKSLMAVMPSGQCNSSCALIVFAAVRKGAGTVGIHRPYYDKEYFKGLSSSEAEKKYKIVDKLQRQYLLDMNVPTILIDKMLTIPSTKIEYIDLEDYKDLAGKYPPAFGEWVTAKCGALTDREERDYDYLEALFSLNMRLIPFGNDPQSRRQRDSLHKKARIAASFTNDYKAYLKTKGDKHLVCMNESVINEQKKIYKAMFDHI